MRRGWFTFSARWLAACGLCAVIGCESAPHRDHSGGLTRRRAQEIASSRLERTAQEPLKPSDDVPSRPIGPSETQPASAVDVETQIPDPIEEARRVARELDSAEVTEQQKRELQRLQERLDAIRRVKTIQMSLADVIRRAVRNSYAIQTESYNPAIETTRVVEAEAQFDAVFFTNFSNNKQDRPSSSQLQGTESETRTFDAGVRKLLSTGMQVQASYALTRTETNLAFQTLNPSYFNQFIVDFRQPLLRGFGLDFNRAEIELRRLDRAISIERLRRSIRETIFNTEQAYWRLFQARRNIAVSARLLSNLETIFNSLQQRLQIGYDAYIAQVMLTESRIQKRLAEFIRLRADVMDAEDALKRLMNDPNINQAMDVEIIPGDAPSIEPVVIDQLGELTAALMYRAELREAKLTIEQTQQAIGVAKNQALPKLDLLFRYIVDGLGGNPDRAFSQLSENDFNEYVIQIEFEWPIGNRGPEASLRRARLQQAQAIASHRNNIEVVINEVNTAIRDLQTNYDQIGPSLRAAQASQEQLRATILRAEARTPANLQVELDAHEALAASRQQLLQVLANYNIALINLERQKGTLLKFNNIVIRGVDEDSYLDPYRPVGP